MGRMDRLLRLVSIQSVNIFLQKKTHLIITIPVIEQHNVRSPDILRRNIQHFNPSILIGIPSKFIVEPFLRNPQVRGHNLVLQVDFNQLRNFQSQPNSERFRVVNNGPNQTVVVSQKVIVQPLRARVRLETCWNCEEKQNHVRTL